jgi:hypothetical protein
MYKSTGVFWRRGSLRHFYLQVSWRGTGCRVCIDLKATLKSANKTEVAMNGVEHASLSYDRGTMGGADHVLSYACANLRASSRLRLTRTRGFRVLLKHMERCTWTSAEVAVGSPDLALVILWCLRPGTSLTFGRLWSCR